jgi:hypothetical protein
LFFQEANNRITSINSRIDSIAATAAQSSQLGALQAVVAKLAADQKARDASVSAAMKDIYASIRCKHVVRNFILKEFSKNPTFHAFSQRAPRDEDDSRTQR